MKKLLIILFCLVAIITTRTAPVVNVKGLAQFGIVTSMSATDYVAIEIATHPRGIAYQYLTGGLATISYVTTFVNSATGNVATITILNNTSNALVSVINATNTALIATINFTSNAVYQASTNISGVLGSNNVRVAAGTATTVSTGSSGGLMIYTVGSLLDTNVIGTNTAGILASNNVRVAAGANVTVTPSASGGVMTYTVASTASGVTEIQTNGVRVGLVTNINFTAGVTGSVSASTAILGVSGSGSASLTGTTNFLQLSVQAGKPPTTNYVGIDAGWQDLELLYYKTNAEGSIAPLSASWQFIVPQDYATNTLKVRIYSTLAITNGPNTSNTIYLASVLRATPSDSTDLHTASFGSTVSGTNTWTQSTSNTNKVQSVVINLSTTSALAAGDLCILKLARDAVNDTFGGVTSVVGLQLEYTRP